MSGLPDGGSAVPPGELRRTCRRDTFGSTMRAALFISAFLFSAGCSREDEPATPNEPRPGSVTETPESGAASIRRVLDHNRAFLGQLPAALDLQAFGLWQRGPLSGSLRLLQRARPFALREEWHPLDRATPSVMTATDGRYAYRPQPLAVGLGMVADAPMPLGSDSTRATLEDAFFLAALYFDPALTRGHVGHIGAGVLRQRSDWSSADLQKRRLSSPS